MTSSVCNKRVSMTIVDGAVRKAKDVLREVEEIWGVETFASLVCCTSAPLSKVGSSVAGVMGNESVPDDWEVERDTRVEANGVVAGEDIALVRLWGRV